MFIMKNDNTIFIPIPNYPKRRFIYARGEVGRAMKTEALVKERKKGRVECDWNISQSSFVKLVYFLHRDLVYKEIVYAAPGKKINHQSLVDVQLSST